MKFQKSDQYIGLLVLILLATSVAVVTPHLSREWRRYQLEQKLANSPEVAATLELIAQVNGTDNPDGYRMLLDGSKFESLDQHPQHFVCLKPSPNICSSSAGRYQIMGSYWDFYASSLNIKDFSEHSQDLVALDLIRRSGALEQLEAGNVRAGLNELRVYWSLSDSPFTRFGEPLPEESLNALANQYHSILEEKEGFGYDY